MCEHDSMDWNIRCKVSWNYWNFWSLRQSDLLQLLSRLTEASPISINFKSKCILCDVYSTQVFTIIHVDTFHGSKEHFRVTCVVTSFKIQNHYIVANLTVVVHSTEDYCLSSMKFWVLKKVVLFIVLPYHYYIIYIYYIYIYVYI